MANWVIWVEFLEQRLGAAGLVGGEWLIFGNTLGALAQVALHDEKSDKHQGDRAAPEQQRDALDGRAIEDEIAIADDHEIDDFLVGLARLNHAADFPAQIDGQFGIGVGNGLVLADQAAQFFESSAGAFRRPDRRPTGLLRFGLEAMLRSTRKMRQKRGPERSCG
jgi:hypothetical protein